MIIIFTGLFTTSCVEPAADKPGWPAFSGDTKPWTRWWWHGSALTREGITAEMEAYQKAGIGGVEITPIYGVLGYEDRFINHLSDDWMALLEHTLKEGERLGLGIDMATGTGWPFGGPWIGNDHASKNVQHKIYELKGGETLKEEIEFIQSPFLRAVGNQIYEVHDNAAAEGRKVQGTRKEPLMRLDPGSINIKDLSEPIAANKNLQRLALDQIQFEKELPLQILMGYGDDGSTMNLTDKVDANGKLNWTAPSGHWKLYAVFQGWHGKMVERAGPGGEGYVIDHFSKEALQYYLHRFDSAFKNYDIRFLRAFFNDSYEVDDARGSADWSPQLLEEFKKRRGYNLHDHLPALFGKDDPEKNRRILCDYRETIAELLLENFTEPWKNWAHGKSAIVRNQAHGSPANILDLYATVDIPEIEGVEPLRIRMASSAGNVTGKKLVSSESATWLNEHFESNLADIKNALDRFMLNGVNHVFYHGTSYSPPGEPWPGWLFYAAVHLNPRNPQWNDFDALNTYVTRCQSFLQATQPDNDVLLYYPVYDRFSTPGNEMIEHFDGIGRQFENTPFEYAAEFMLKTGYTFDFVSDMQLKKVKWENGSLITEGNSRYKTIVIPRCNFIPLATFQKFIALAEEGATVILLQGPPSSTSGFSGFERNNAELEKIVQRLSPQKNTQGISAGKLGSGRILEGDSLGLLLEGIQIKRETMTDVGISFIRKKDTKGNPLYFVRNGKETSFDGWITLEKEAGSVFLYDAMTGASGKGKIRNTDNGKSELYLQLPSRGTLIVQVFNNSVEGSAFPYYKTTGEPIVLRGPWKINFTSGGPVLPQTRETDTLKSWTTFEGQDYKSFSGSASYITSFRVAGQADAWLLDLGEVKESADVILNGQLLGTLIGPTYQLFINPMQMKEENVLEVRVSNLMGNRIAEMDRQNILWKKFYNINFPARKAENRKGGLFNAAHWNSKDSGLIGPVRLISQSNRFSE